MYCLSFIVLLSLFHILVWFTLIQTFTITPILLPIHLKFAGDQYSSKSMNRALISSLVSTSEGLDLLWIHLFLLLWLTLTWISTILWICKGVSRFYSKLIDQCSNISREDSCACLHPHDEGLYDYSEGSTNLLQNEAVQLRTVMVSNIPSRLRSDVQ